MSNTTKTLNFIEQLEALGFKMADFAAQLLSEVEALPDYDDGEWTYAPLSRKFVVTVGEGVKDRNTTPKVFDDVGPLLEYVAGYHRETGESDAAKNASDWIIGGSFDDNPEYGRTDLGIRNIEFVQWDFDAGDFTDVDLIEIMDATGLAYCLYSTWSHLENGVKHKYRVGVPLADTFKSTGIGEDRELYKRGYIAWGKQTFGDTFDPVTHNLARLFFVASAPKSRIHLAKRHIKAQSKLLDFNAFCDALPPIEEAKPKAKKAKLDTRDREEFNAAWRIGRASFNAADFARDHDKTAKTHGSKVETACPFDEEEHKTKDVPGDTPVVWYNAEEAKYQTATVCCLHGTCKVKNKRTAGDFVFAVLGDLPIETLGDYIDDVAVAERFADWLEARPVTLEQCEDAIAAAIADNPRGLDNVKVVAALNMLARFRDEIRLAGLIERLADGIKVGVGRIEKLVKAQAKKLGENAERAQESDDDQYEQRPESDNDLPDGFVRRADGLYCNGVRVCGNIELKRAARTDASENWSLEFEITNAEGGKALVLIKNEDRSTAFHEVMGQLASCGLWINSNAVVQSEFRRLLNDWQTNTYDTLLKQPGYHSGGNAFTHLGGTIVKDGSGLDANRFVYSVPEKEQPRGTLEGWRKATSSEFMLGDHRQCMALHTLWGVSSPVFHYAKHPSVSLHAYGSSGHGKTTSQAFQVSAWGRPESGAWLFPTMKATTNALEGALPRANNMTLAYDEAKHAEPKAVVGLGFTIAAEQYKARLNTSGDEKPRPVWSGVPTSFSSEQSLEQFGAEARQTVVAGASVRAIGIPVSGIKKRDPQEVDRHVAMICANFGVAGPALVNECWRRGFTPGCAKVMAMVDAYTIKLLGSSSDASRSRWGRHVKPFAIMGVTGELMVAAGILDWTNDDVLKIVRWGWEAFLGSSAAQGSDVGKAGVAALKAYLVTHMGHTVVRLSELAASRTYTGVIACYDAEYVYLFKHRVKDIDTLATDPETLIAALAAQDLLRLCGKNRVWTKGPFGDVKHIRVRWPNIDAVTLEKDDTLGKAAADVRGQAVKHPKPALSAFRRIHWRS